MEITTKLNLYLTKKRLKKNFLKPILAIKINLINDERFWRKEPIKERKNFKK